MKNPLIALIVLVIIGGGVYLFMQQSPKEASTPTPGTTASTTQSAESAPEPKTESVIGTSAQGRSITAYHFGTGSTEILFVGAIHGGYTPNTARLAYEAIDYFKKNPDAVPTNVTVTVIPVLNPDGLYKVVGTTTANFSQADVAVSVAAQIAGRFNGNTVDLNRNFACDWQPKAVWQGRTVSGGSGAFSEPESQAIKTYVETRKPEAVVVWYAAAGGVYASSCGSGISSETLTLTNIYAEAARYTAYNKYSADAIPGDMANWLAQINVPAISVLLTNRTSSEWIKNQAGITAVLTHYAQ